MGICEPSGIEESWIKRLCISRAKSVGPWGETEGLWGGGGVGWGGWLCINPEVEICAYFYIYIFLLSEYY